MFLIVADNLLSNTKVEYSPNKPNVFDRRYNQDSTPGTIQRELIGILPDESRK